MLVAGPLVDLKRSSDLPRAVAPKVAQVSEARQGKYTDSSAVPPREMSKNAHQDWIEDNPTPLTSPLPTHFHHSKTFSN